VRVYWRRPANYIGQVSARYSSQEQNPFYPISPYDAVAKSSTPFLDSSSTAVRQCTACIITKRNSVPSRVSPLSGTHVRDAQNRWRRSRGDCREAAKVLVLGLNLNFPARLGTRTRYITSLGDRRNTHRSLNSSRRAFRRVGIEIIRKGTRGVDEVCCVKGPRKMRGWWPLARPCDQGDGVDETTAWTSRWPRRWPPRQSPRGWPGPDGKPKHIDDTAVVGCCGRRSFKQTTIHLSHSPNTPTTRHQSVEADDDTFACCRGRRRDGRRLLWPTIVRRS
jgi:hypothetical protein